MEAERERRRERNRTEGCKREKNRKEVLKRQKENDRKKTIDAVLFTIYFMKNETCVY